MLRATLALAFASAHSSSETSRDPTRGVSTSSAEARAAATTWSAGERSCECALRLHEVVGDRGRDDDER